MKTFLQFEMAWLNNARVTVWRNILRSIGLLLVFMCHGQLTYAAVFYVSPSSSGTGDGSSWVNASSNIGAILSAAVVGDEIYLQAGNYGVAHFGAANTANTHFFVNKGVLIYGGFNGEASPEDRVLNSDKPWDFAHPTIFDGGAGKRVVELNNGASIDGVTITGGSVNDGGGGLHLTGSFAENCIVQNNTANTGGGVILYDNSQLSYSLILNNQTQAGGPNGGRTGGGVTIANDGPSLLGCYVSNNISQDQGGGLYFQGVGEVINCVINNNASTDATNGRGGGAFFSERGKLINCTLAHNTAAHSGAGANDAAQGGVIYNTVFWHNGALNATGIDGGSTVSYDIQNFAGWGDFGGVSPVVDFLGAADATECFEAPTATIGNSPGMTAASIGNWSLIPGSPLVDMGNDALNSESWDIVQNQRKHGVIDLGAYEQIPVAITSISISDNVHTFDGASKGVAVTVTPDVAYVVEYREGTDSYSTTLPIDAGSYDVRVTITAPGYIGEELGTLTIHPKALTVSINAVNKVYDGTTSVPAIDLGSFVISGLVVADDVSVSGYTAATFDDKHVGVDKSVTVTGIVFVGDDTDNYSLPTSTINASSRITRMPVTITVDAGQTKIYDKDAANPAAYSYTATALPGGDVYTGALSRVAGENVNTYAITRGTLTPYTDGEASAGANYLVTFVSDDFEITSKDLVITGLSAQSKVYDATATATISGGALNGVVSGDNVAYAYTASFDTKNVGLVKPVSATFNLTGGTEVNNYTLTQPSGFTADITPRELVIIGFRIADRAPVVGDMSADIEDWGTLQTIPTPDIGKVAIKQDGVTASFPTDEAGTHQVTVSPLELEGVEAGNYTLKQPDDPEATISTDLPTFDWSAQPLETTYNGLAYSVVVVETHNTTNATVDYDHGDGNGWVADEPIDAGIYLVRATSIDVTYPGSQTRTLTIDPKLIPAATFDTGTKVFDNTTNVDPQPSLVLEGIEARDLATVSATGDNAFYDTKNVGAAKTVTITNVALQGVGADNYSIPDVATNSTWSITKLSFEDVPLVFSFEDQEKFFDGTTSVKKDGVETLPSITISGFLSGDVFTATATSAAYDSPAAGTGKTVTLSGIIYSNNATDNYDLPTVLTNSNSVILKLPLADLGASMFISDQSKVYDGTTDVKDGFGDIYIPEISFLGLIAGFDDVTATGSVAVYGDKYVGAGKSVTVGDITFGGGDAGNYELPTTVVNTNSAITPVSVAELPDLEVVFDNQSKVYDGTVTVKDAAGTVYVPALSINGLLAGDVVTAVGTLAEYDSKDAGDNKTVTITGVTYDGADAGNYTFPATVVNTNSAITPVSVAELPDLEVVFDNQSKVYDGTVTVKDAAGTVYVPALSINGLLAGDVMTAVGTLAEYDSKDAGDNKTVTITGVTYDGADAGNYTFLATVVNTNSAITRVSVAELPDLEVVFDNQSKVYDGTVTVKDAGGTVYVPALSINGLLAGDVVTAVGTLAGYDSKDAGDNKTVTITGVTYDGADAGNYNFPATVVNTNSAITPVSVAELPDLEVVFDNQSKVYDGTVTVKDAGGTVYVPALSINGLLAGDVVTAVGTLAEYDSKDAGDNKTVTITGVTYDGADAGNYTLPATVGNDLNAIDRKPIVIVPLEGQEKNYNDEVVYIDYDVQPERLDNDILIKEELNGALSWNGNRSLGAYEIEQGNLTNENNPNYDISFNQGVSFVIVSDVHVIRKWGYMLLVDNANDAFSGYQWYLNGLAMTGETNQYYANEAKMLCGIYKCEVTLQDGTKIMSPEYEFLDGCSQQGSTFLYPNPVSPDGQFFLKNGSRIDQTDFLTEENQVQVDIYSVSGTLLQSYRVELLENVGIQAPSVSGMYIVWVTNNDGEVVKCKLLVTH